MPILKLDFRQEIMRGSYVYGLNPIFSSWDLEWLIVKKLKIVKKDGFRAIKEDMQENGMGILIM